MVDLSEVKNFDRLEAMLADPDIDLIDVCNPTQPHPATAIAALKAGKHVLVEKAIALTPEDADAMLAAARAGGQAAHGRSCPAVFPRVRVRGGGGPRRPVGQAAGRAFQARHLPAGLVQRTIGDAAKTGGPAVDLHIHDTHFIGLVCGVPGRVFSSGTWKTASVQYLTTQYLYGPGGPAVSCSSGAVAMSGRPFVHGYEIYLEKATLVYESGVAAADGLSRGRQDGAADTGRRRRGDDGVHRRDPGRGGRDRGEAGAEAAQRPTRPRCPGAVLPGMRFGARRVRSLR